MEVLLVAQRRSTLDTLGRVVRQALGEVRLRSAYTLGKGLEQAGAAANLDLVLLDLGLPGCCGIDALLRFRHAFPWPRVVVVSAIQERDCATAALEAGAVGYLPKSLSPDAMAAAVRIVGSGETYVPPPEAFSDAPSARALARSALRLTQREIDLLQLLAQGSSNRDIAQELAIHESSVPQHVHDLLRALGASSRVEALVIAARRGLSLD